MTQTTCVCRASDTQSVFPVVQHTTDHGAILLPYSMPGAQGARHGDPSICDSSIWKAEEKHCEFVVSLDYHSRTLFQRGTEERTV